MTVSCMLFAAPRSGTTLLGDAVSRSFEAAWPQEIFDEAYTRPEGDYRADPDLRVRANFFNYRNERLREDSRLSYPSKSNQSNLFNAYVQNLYRSEGAERFLIDIKYTSVHHLDSYWRLPYGRPNLIGFVHDLGLPVAHLTRRNLFALYCSQRYAEITGIWATLEGDRAPEPMAIEPRHCRRFMTEMYTLAERFRDWLADYPVHELEYESLMSGPEFSDRVRETFTRIYGISARSPLATRYHKVTPPLRAIVSNAQEVLESLRGTPFLAMAEESLEGNAG
jgi:hypothetical protein